MAQEPPQPGRAALGGLVVGDYPGVLGDPCSACGGLEDGGIGQRVASALTRLGRQVAVEVEEGGAGDVAFTPETLAGARVA